MHIITNTGLFPLPRPRNCSNGGSVVGVYPDTVLNRHKRREIDRRDFAYINIEADPLNAEQQDVRPGDFHHSTLQWALHSASLVVVWAGDIPYDREQFTRTLDAHTCPRGRIILAMVRENNHEEWSRFVAEHAQNGTEFLLITTTGIPTTQCSTSGAIH